MLVQMCLVDCILGSNHLKCMPIIDTLHYVRISVVGMHLLDINNSAITGNLKQTATYILTGLNMLSL